MKIVAGLQMYFMLLALSSCIVICLLVYCKFYIKNIYRKIEEFTEKGIDGKFNIYNMYCLLV